jgi:CheY-like chemotaxis protein
MILIMSSNPVYQPGRERTLAIDHITTGGLTSCGAREQAETAPISVGGAAEPGFLRTAETRGILPPEQATNAANLGRTDGAKQARVLVVEDEILVAMDANDRLGDLGYEVCGTATTAEEAVAFAREQCPDLVLMDLNLGGPRDGIQAAAEIRMLDPAVGIVFMTAYADPVNRARMAALDPDGIVIKPYTDADFTRAVEHALMAGRSRRR